MPIDQQPLFFVELIGLIAAGSFFIRSWGKVLEYRAKARAISAQSASDRELADTHTRELVNSIAQKQSVEIQDLRGEITTLKTENVAYKAKDVESDRRMTAMQTRIDSLVEAVAELRVSLRNTEESSAKERAEFQVRLAEKDAQLAAKETEVCSLQSALSDCQASKVDYTA